ncbi:hypothetical protein ANCCEY_12914 [Ancylostoma ceylanicum]|uniref:glucuronosyltransferase n=1 Tax=Ancylostoma ceylanicum TaxID=53326 RepID=A0A0D6LDK4_9BILA|nr:hypothetical protein ANCCEY_12914 [Ancylostoma ceylanicum]
MEEYVFKESDSKMFGRFSLQISMILDTCRATVENKELLPWLKREKFDLAFAHMFDWIRDRLRRQSRWNSTDTKLCTTLIADPETELFRTHVSPDFPNLMELAAKCPLVMANTNELYEAARPTLAKVVNIGGIGMEVKDSKPIPEEAIHSGVPVISIPLVGDQPKNAALAEHHGFGITLRKGEISVESVSRALEEIITNTKYRDAVKRLSKMMDHKPVSPTHLLVKWAEFAAEFQTLENLEPAGNKLNFFQYHSLDRVQPELTS